MKKNNCSFANSFIGKLISLLIFKAKFQKITFLKVVRVFKNKKTVYSELHCDAEVKLILPIDESYVIAIDKKNNLKLWLTETGKESVF